MILTLWGATSSPPPPTQTLALQPLYWPVIAALMVTGLAWSMLYGRTL